jgi:hypothetical protein
MIKTHVELRYRNNILCSKCSKIISIENVTSNNIINILQQKIILCRNCIIVQHNKNAATTYVVYVQKKIYIVNYIHNGRTQM